MTGVQTCALPIWSIQVADIQKLGGKQEGNDRQHSEETWEEAQHKGNQPSKFFLPMVQLVYRPQSLKHSLLCVNQSS